MQAAYTDAYIEQAYIDAQRWTQDHARNGLDAYLRAIRCAILWGYHEDAASYTVRLVRVARMISNW
jgi:hypothetical protein